MKTASGGVGRAASFFCASLFAGRATCLYRRELAGTRAVSHILRGSCASDPWSGMAMGGSSCRSIRALRYRLIVARVADGVQGR